MLLLGGYLYMSILCLWGYSICVLNILDVFFGNLIDVCFIYDSLWML